MGREECLDPGVTEDGFFGRSGVRDIKTRVIGTARS